MNSIDRYHGSSGEILYAATVNNLITFFFLRLVAAMVRFATYLVHVMMYFIVIVFFDICNGRKLSEIVGCW